MKKIFDQYSKQSVSLKTLEKHRRLVQAAVMLMQERRYRKGLTMARLVQELDTNETTLKQAFKRIMGPNLSAYLHTRCMELAMKMLTEGICVTEVAYETGYSAIGHFSYAFKRTFGICPSRYATHAAERKDNENGAWQKHRQIRILTAISLC